MKKSIINISLVFAFIFSMFFIGTGNVSAGSKSCTCVYENTICNAGDYRYEFTFVLDDNGTADGSLVNVTRGSNAIGSSNWPEFKAGDTAPTADDAKKAASDCKTSNCPTLLRRIFVNLPFWKNPDCVKQVAFHTKMPQNLGWTDDNMTIISATANSSNKSSEDVVKDNQKKALDNMQTNITDIIEWGQKYTVGSLYKENKLKNACVVIDGDVKKLINEVLTIISVASIILLIIMSMIEFVKAITGANDDLIKTAFKHTIIRIVCVVILFLLPILVSSIIDLVNKINEPQTDENGNYKIGDDGNPLCGIGK